MRGIVRQNVFLHNYFLAGMKNLIVIRTKNVKNAFLSFKKTVFEKLFALCRPVYHFALAAVAVAVYRFPARRLTVIGVTGTKGKSTVVELLHHIFQESGARVASLSSLRFRIGDHETPNDLKMTMPGRFFIQKFLYDAREARCRYAIIEVTSEGIKQFRHRFIVFRYGVVTNVAPEHVEAHGSFERYLRAKLDLFWRIPKSGSAVINKDDGYADRFAASTPAHKVFYGREGIETGEKKLTVKNVKITGEEIRFDLDHHEVVSSLLGEFNFFNILAATATGLAAHISLEKIIAAVAKVAAVPGRMEFVRKEPFAVVIDYAHTPDSLKGVYAFLKMYQATCKGQGGKLICVLGSAGGGRDKWKRPAMGRIAAEYCDEIFLTTEDPYDEDPHVIIDHLIEGIPLSERIKVRTHLDRRLAISEALRSASEGDVVVCTGKGSEPWIIGLRNTRLPWSERRVVEEELQHISTVPENRP